MTILDPRTGQTVTLDLSHLLTPERRSQAAMRPPGLGPRSHGSGFLGEPMHELAVRHPEPAKPARA